MFVCAGAVQWRPTHKSDGHASKNWVHDHLSFFLITQLGIVVLVTLMRAFGCVGGAFWGLYMRFFFLAHSRSGFCFARCCVGLDFLLPELPSVGELLLPPSLVRLELLLRFADFGLKIFAGDDPGAASVLLDLRCEVDGEMQVPFSEEEEDTEVGESEEVVVGDSASALPEVTMTG